MLPWYTFMLSSSFALWVCGGYGTIDLGLNVSPAGCAHAYLYIASVHISALTALWTCGGYETIDPVPRTDYEIRVTTSYLSHVHIYERTNKRRSTGNFASTTSWPCGRFETIDPVPMKDYNIRHTTACPSHVKLLTKGGEHVDPPPLPLEPVLDMRPLIQYQWKTITSGLLQLAFLTWID